MWREERGVPEDTPDLCLGLLGVTVAMMGVRFEGEGVELGGNLLSEGPVGRGDGCPQGTGAGHRATFQALCLAWNMSHLL